MEEKGKESEQYDVIVVGAGPCGSTAAAILAEKGRRVLVIEKEKFPRYHVGESLMPFCYFTLDRLGLIDEVNAQGYVNKHSVQFVTEDGSKSRPFYFFQHYDHPSSTTWQVERSTFDMMLFEKAKANGAEAIEETRVLDVIRDGDGGVIGVRALTAGESEPVDYHAPVTIDASGRDGLVSMKQRWRRRDPKLNKISIWTYYRGAMRDEGLDAGSTTVAYLPGKGWFWYIPLRDDIVSVGVVAERDYLYAGSREPDEIFKREIGKNAWIEEHLAGSEQFGEYWVTGEYSYRSEYCASDGVVLAGDAFAFLDPVFSSGVFLALKSGEMAADAVDAALDAGDCSGEQFKGYGEVLCEMIEIMRNLVYAFYDQNFSFGELIRHHPDVRGDLTDCLIGNVDDRRFKELFDAVAELAELPPKLDHGRRAATTH